MDANQKFGNMTTGKNRADRGKASHVFLNDKQQLTAWREKLEPFPNLFQLEAYNKLPSGKWRSIRDKMKAERSEGLATVMEDARAANLIAFSSFLLGDYKEAFDETHHVLNQLDPNNLVSHAHMATFLWERSVSPDAEEQLKLLQQIANDSCNFSAKVLEGKAELAHCYSRMGLKYYLLAVEVFEQVVKERPSELDWKYGLALCLKRCTSLNHRLIHVSSSEDVVAKAIKAFDLFQEIKNSKTATNEIRAQAAAELGYLFGVKASDIRKALKVKAPHIQAKDLYREAQGLAPNNVMVLTYSGCFFYNDRQFELAIQLLERAVRIRGSVKNYHQLGLAYSKKANYDKQFRKQNKDVQLAIKSFEKSLEVAHGENPAAHRDLGFIYERLGEYDEALNHYLCNLGQIPTQSRPWDSAKAYEQCGKIYLKLSERQQEDKLALKKYGIACLTMSLTITSQACANIPEFKDSLRQKGFSFRTLRNIIRNDPDIEINRQAEEAKLLHKVGDYAKSLELLSDISLYDDSDAIDPEFLELKLDCYVKNGQLDDAVSFLNMMTCMGHHFKNPDLPLQTYVMAAKKKLLESAKVIADMSGDDIGRCLSLNTAIKFQINDGMAKRYFRWAFEFVYPREAFSGTGDIEDEYGIEAGWQVMILHDPDDPEIMRIAGGVKNIFRDVCGLEVTCMDDDVPPGSLLEMGVVDFIYMSQVLVVLTGDQKLSLDFISLYLGHTVAALTEADSRSREMVVLNAGGARPPRALRTSRCKEFPRILLDRCQQSPSSATPSPQYRYSVDEIEAIYDLFCMMLGREIDVK